MATKVYTFFFRLLSSLLFIALIFFTVVTIRTTFALLYSAIFNIAVFRIKYAYVFLDKVLLIVGGIAGLAFIIYVDFRIGKQTKLGNMALVLAGHVAIFLLVLFGSHITTAILTPGWKLTIFDIIIYGGELLLGGGLLALSRHGRG